MSKEFKNLIVFFILSLFLGMLTSFLVYYPAIGFGRYGVIAVTALLFVTTSVTTLVQTILTFLIFYFSSRLLHFSSSLKIASLVIAAGLYLGNLVGAVVIIGSVQSGTVSFMIPVSFGHGFVEFIIVAIGLVMSPLWLAAEFSAIAGIAIHLLRNGKGVRNV
ncbi:MAG: hypothetical protein PXX82_04425 [Methanomassiliicoccales archaeon]|nr:hypothetical protein [Methanomassiliicoccales archaeon]